MPPISGDDKQPDYELAVFDLEHAAECIATYVPRLEQLAYMERVKIAPKKRPPELAILYVDLYEAHQSGERAFRQHLHFYPHLKDEWISATLLQFKMTLVEGLRAVMVEKSNLLLRCAALCRGKAKLGKFVPKDVTHYFYGEVHMGDTFSAHQVGVMGGTVHAHDMTVQQFSQQAVGRIDLPSLAQELGKLRMALKADATTAEEDATVGEIALAEVAAIRNDEPDALCHLKNAGKWALSVAEKIGVGVATSALKTVLGI